MPQLAASAEIETIQFRQVASSDLGLGDIIALALEIERAVANGADGIVVTQGTDTLEETSFALDLLWSGDVPVVVTGAMRNPASPGADGPANLAAATSATSPLARGLGMLVVFNDEIHLPIHVRKTHATRTATFRSPLTGPIGWVLESRTRIAVRPPARHNAQIPPFPKRSPPVALLKLGPGEEGLLVPAIATLGYRGAVGEAFGGGHVPSPLVPSLAKLARRDAGDTGFAHRVGREFAGDLWLRRVGDGYAGSRPVAGRKLGWTQGMRAADAAPECASTRRCDPLGVRNRRCPRRDAVHALPAA